MEDWRYSERVGVQWRTGNTVKEWDTMDNCGDTVKERGHSGRHGAHKRGEGGQQGHSGQWDIMDRGVVMLSGSAIDTEAAQSNRDKMGSRGHRVRMTLPGHKGGGHDSVDSRMVVNLLLSLGGHEGHSCVFSFFLFFLTILFFCISPFSFFFL